MSSRSTFPLPATVSLVCTVCALAISATAQITVTSPTNGSTYTTGPIQMTASVSSCAGSSNITLFGYSIDSSPFLTDSPNNGTSKQINSTEYRLSSQPSPGAQYTVHYKAWSDKGACPVQDVTIHVQGPTTYSAQNVDDVANANWTPNACPETQKSTYGLVGWFWVWDTGTAQCTCPSTISGLCSGADSTTYTSTTAPNIDGESRLFYVNSKAYSPSNGTPGERSSEKFGTDANATHFVYDGYVYFTDPQNIQNLELDTNAVDSSGGVYIFGLQCAYGSKTWEYTTKSSSGNSQWTPSGVACNPHTSLAANQWHHVQLAAHRSGSNVSYDSVTLDGVTSNFNLSNLDSYFSKGWSAGSLLLNFQLDAINNGGAQTTITGYLDGMTMIWW